MGKTKVEKIVKGRCATKLSYVAQLDGAHPGDAARVVEAGGDFLKLNGIKKTAKRVAKQGGDPLRIDTPREIRKLASSYARKVGCPYYEGGKQIGYVHKSVTARDVSAYLKLRKERPALNHELGFDAIRGPLAEHVLNVPLREVSSWRGLAVFDKFATEVSKLLDETRGVRAERRNVTFLYPGAGRDYSYLQTIFTAIKDGGVTSAIVIATELELDDLTMIHNLQQLETAKVIKKYGVWNPKEFEEDGEKRGTERVFQFKYPGPRGDVPIKIILAKNRSGTAYFRDEYLKRADVVIISDPSKGDISASHNLLNEVLTVKARVAPDRKQLVLMEGRSADGHAVHPFPMPAKPHVDIPGAYGHCRGAGGMGEFFNCSYQSAYSFRLDQVK